MPNLVFFDKPSLFCLYSESGEMCAMKEVVLFLDDAQSKECAKQLRQVSLKRNLEIPISDLVID